MNNNTPRRDERQGLPSASNWRRHELCPGSWQLAQEARNLGQEAHTENEAAERGTRIHAFLAGNEIKLGASEQQTADFLQERMQEQIKRIFGDQPFTEVKEKRFWFLCKNLI
jgi:hypothetical protein